MFRSVTLGFIVAVTVTSTSFADRPTVWIGKDVYIQTKTPGEVDQITAELVGNNIVITHSIARSNREEVIVDIPALSVGRLHLVGDDDRDEFINRAPVHTIMFGGAGNDLLIGGPLRDRLNGNEGKDYLRGGAGGDVLDPGSDLIEGEAILGGDAGDRLVRTRFVGLYLNMVASSFDQVFQEDLDGRVGTDATPLNTQFRSVYLQMPNFTTLLNQLRRN